MAWTRRDLSKLEVVYWWADGLYVKAGIEDRKSALLTIVGVLSNGEKVVLACESGERESKEGGLQVLRDLKHRGLTFPRLTVADGHLGIWAACGELHPTGAEQRGWNHKITNILDDLPKKAPQKAAELRKAMPYAETKADGEQRRDDFVRTYRKTEGKAVDTLLRDWERMVTFYSLPPGALAPSADHEHRGIPLLLGAAPHGCVPPLQACGGSQGDDLEDAPGRREVVEEADCAGCSRWWTPARRSRMV